MEKLLVLIIAVCMLFACAAVVSAADSPTIYVTGDSTVSMPADKATISFGVVTQAVTAAEAVAENASKSNAVVDAVFAAGINKKDIKTSRYSIDAVMEYPKDHAPKTVGYKVTNSVTITTKDLKKIGDLIDSAAKAGANDIDNISFSTDDPTSARNEALEAAVKQARDKAQIIADALGVKLGKVLSVNESYSGPVQREEPIMYAKAMGAMNDSAPTPILSGDVNVTVHVNINFEIINK